jgi:uncharacterized repeat protein (TIGR03803 family)
VFELSPTAKGSWTETILYNFNGTDGSQPYGGLIFDTSGNIYGTTYQGGDNDNATVFELSPIASGGWTETVLHSFACNNIDGYYPFAAVIFDATGNLYGTTTQGGSSGVGTVFQLTPTGVETGRRPYSTISV